MRGQNITGHFKSTESILKDTLIGSDRSNHRP